MVERYMHFIYRREGNKRVGEPIGIAAGRNSKEALQRYSDEHKEDPGFEPRDYTARVVKLAGFRIPTSTR